MRAEATGRTWWTPRKAAHAFTLFFLGAWAAFSMVVESYVMPSPWAVVVRLAAMFQDIHELATCCIHSATSLRLWAFLS